MKSYCPALEFVSPLLRPPINLTILDKCDSLQVRSAVLHVKRSNAVDISNESKPKGGGKRQEVFVKAAENVATEECVRLDQDKRNIYFTFNCRGKRKLQTKS